MGPRAQGDGLRWGKGSSQGRKAANKVTAAHRLVDLVGRGYPSSLLIASAASVTYEAKSPIT